LPKIRDLAKVVRSKNAGPFYLTLDVIFNDKHTYEKVKTSQAINVDTMCSLYRVRPDQVRIIPYDKAYAIKITLDRPVPAADVSDTDIYGTQQHAPLLDIEIPVTK
jgi:hypothetical protein